MKQELTKLAINRFKPFGVFNNVVETKIPELALLLDSALLHLCRVDDKFGNCDYSVIFIPLIKKLYLNYNETCWIKIYKEFKNWYYTEGIIWERDVKNITDEEYIKLYLIYYENNL